MVNKNNMEEKIVTLTTTTYQHAHLIKSLLESEEIYCFLKNVNVIGGTINLGVTVSVKSCDLEKAIQLMASIEQAGLEKALNKNKIKNSPPRILVPIDFSDYSLKAANMALDWAILLKADIVFINVFFNPIISTLPFSDNYVYDSEIDKIMMDMEEKAESKMKKFIATFKEKRDLKGGEDIKIKKKLLRGVAEDEIIKYSKENEPSIIIMGTRGKDKKAEDLIGSVTAEVMERAKFPVLAVPEDFNYKGIKNIKNILYITTFDEADMIALDKLEHIVKPLDLKIFFIHVGIDSKKWEDSKLDNFKEFVEKRFTNTQVEYDIVESEDFWVGIEGFIRNKNIDIISLTTKRRNLVARLINPSVGKKMLFHTNTPILMFHA